jgi:tetratricopeptide (TPR) repeat protein
VNLSARWDGLGRLPEGQFSVSQKSGHETTVLTTLSRLLRETAFVLPLRSRWQRGVFLFGLGMSALLLAYGATRWAYAEKLGTMNQLQQLQRAAALDARNPEFYDKLGLVCLFSVDASRTAEAVKYFERATRLAPRRAEYWADLASACDWSADLACSDESLNQAVRLSPMTPRFQWLTANHYIRTERASLALPHLRRLLSLSAEYAQPAFDLCAHAFGDPDIVLGQVLSPQSDPALQLAFLNYEANHGQLEVAARIWSGISTAHLPFNLVQPYFLRLVDAGEIEQAETVWNDLQRQGTVPASEARDNLVFNGSFERAPLNAGFDWQFRKLPYIHTDFAAPSAAGAHCLRVDFTVARNDEVEPVFELVPVRPSSSYALTFQVRSEWITSDSGPRLRVLDALDPASLNAQSEGTVGTTPWHPVRFRFMTGAHTRLLRLSVWRPRSRSFPPNITGSFWLDDVSLKPEPPGAEGRSTKREP